MNLRILLITAILCQVMMSAGGPIGRACGAMAQATEGCCCCSADESASDACCAPESRPASPAPGRHDCGASSCDCYAIERAPALLLGSSENRLATGQHADAIVGEPSFPILTGGAPVRSVGYASLPPPGNATRRRALLCCWTT